MKAKSNHIKKVLSDNVNKPKKFWSQFKNVFFFLKITVNGKRIN